MTQTLTATASECVIVESTGRLDQIQACALLFEIEALMSRQGYGPDQFRGTFIGGPKSNKYQVFLTSQAEYVLNATAQHTKKKLLDLGFAFHPIQEIDIWV